MELAGSGQSAVGSGALDVADVMVTNHRKDLHASEPSTAHCPLKNAADGGDDVLLVRQGLTFEARGVRQRDILAADALWRGIQVVERSVHDPGDDLAADPALFDGL